MAGWDDTCLDYTRAPIASAGGGNRPEGIADGLHSKVCNSIIEKPQQPRRIGGRFHPWFSTHKQVKVRQEESRIDLRRTS